MVIPIHCTRRYGPFFFGRKRDSTSVAVHSSPDRGVGRSVGGGRLVGGTTARDSVINIAREVSVPELLDPLQKLQVVLHFALHQTISRDDLTRIRFVHKSWLIEVAGRTMISSQKSGAIPPQKKTFRGHLALDVLQVRFLLVVFTLSTLWLVKQFWRTL